MKILITGARGFLGQNLVAELKNRDYKELFFFDSDTPKKELYEWAKICDFVYHFAGSNRPVNEEEFEKVNRDLTQILVEALTSNNNPVPIMYSSSIQAERNTPYGHSKKAAEEILFNYSKANEVPVYIYRFANLYGKWSKPNYNSVIATFCHNIARKIPINIDNPNIEVEFQYIDNVLDEILLNLEGKGTTQGKYYTVSSSDIRTIGEVANLIYSFKESRQTIQVPNMGDRFTKNLYSTYLSYIPENNFSYELKMNVDNRGSFTEFLRTPDRGQVSINVSKVGITKGQHWHHSKNEKFLVVKGKGVIRLRKYNDKKFIEYHVSGDKLEVVDIPTGYTHSIVNVGNEDMVTVMWVNEPFNPDNPDTFYLEV